MTIRIHVTGPQGAGKSRLMARIKRHLYADGFHLGETKPHPNGPHCAVADPLPLLNRLDAVQAARVDVAAPEVKKSDDRNH